MMRRNQPRAWPLPPNRTPTCRHVLPTAPGGHDRKVYAEEVVKAVEYELEVARIEFEAAERKFERLGDKLKEAKGDLAEASSGYDESLGAARLDAGGLGGSGQRGPAAPRWLGGRGF